MILITGATGFLGTYMVKAALDRGEPVRALYRDPGKIKNTLTVLDRMGPQEASRLPLLEWFEADILDLVRLEEAFHGVQTVIHCAGMVSFDSRDKQALKKINVEGTANVVHLALRHGIGRFCHISSVAALGHVEPPGLIREDSPWSQEHSSHYGWSKREGELEVWKGIQEGLPAVILNPAVILGPGEWNRGSPLIYRMVRKGLPFYPPSSVALISVQEVTRLCLALLEAGVVNRGFILVQEEWSQRKLLEVLASAMGKRVKPLPLSLAALRVLYNLELVLGVITGRRPQLTRDLLRSFRYSVSFDNTQVLEELSYSYPDLAEQLTQAINTYYDK